MNKHLFHCASISSLIFAFAVFPSKSLSDVIDSYEEHTSISNVDNISGDLRRLNQQLRIMKVILERKVGSSHAVSKINNLDSNIDL